MFRTFAVALVTLIATAALATPRRQPIANPEPPSLYSLRGTPEPRAGGAQDVTPITIDEAAAIRARAAGGMWLPDGTGGRVFAQYTRSIEHANGTWTWVGAVQTVFGPQSAVITFGDGAVYGRIPQPDGAAQRIVREHGETMLLRTDRALMAASPVVRALSAVDDARPVPVQRSTAAASVPHPAEPAAPAGNPVIDVMVAYTDGFAAAQGSASAALARIQNLVDLTNNAYINSNVHQSIRLVGTVEVDYTDTNDEGDALDDVSGKDDSGNTVPIPPSLQPIAGLREQYGADLVVLLRKFDHATNNGCGIGWLIGGNMAAIVPSRDYVYGYSVVSDGSSDGYYCLDTTFAHELGHNMGSNHDRGNADEPGAYSYSYGFKSASPTGFSTIMAYGGDRQTPLAFFSNPDLDACQGQPCGVDDSSPDSADNAHSLNNTGALIAQFMASAAGGTANHARNDINGDGKSDLLWSYASGTNARTGYWLMDGATRTGTWSIPTSTAYRLAATGDFDGDGLLDWVWTSAARDVEFWFGNGTTFRPGAAYATYPAGWSILTAGDIDGDGTTDLLFNTGNGVAWWIIDGSALASASAASRPDGALWWLTNPDIVSASGQATAPPRSHVAATGDFDGDGKLDIAWIDTSSNVTIWFGNGSGFSTSGVRAGTNTTGWTLIGAGDIDGDGKSDLLWEYQSPGTVKFGYWIMDGATVVRTNTFTVNPAYHVVATGDYNGDGKLDIAWTSAADDIQLWIGDGTAFSGFTPVATYTAGWTPVPDTP